MKDTADPKRARNIAFVWDALAPQHVDKLNALVGVFDKIYGVQIYPTSWNYKWTWLPDAHFDPLVVLKKRTGKIGRIFAVPFWCVVARFRRNIPIWVLCNYEEIYTFFSAILLRLTGAKVYVVQNSKFDDYQRKLPMEIVKSIMYAPYNGAIVSGARTRSYLRFLGVKGPIQYGYNVADTARLGAYAQEPGPAFADRPFLWVGRLIPKKNFAMLVHAYAEYCRRCPKPRGLTVVGDGPEKDNVIALAKELGVYERMTMHTWTDQPVVMKAMAESLYLLLPSITEQFGNVVGEAFSVGLPAIITDNAGATDRILWEFRSGFSIPPIDPASWAQAMLDVGDNEPLWRRLRAGAREAVQYFSLDAWREGLSKLIDGEDAGDPDDEVELIESYAAREAGQAFESATRPQ